LLLRTVRIVAGELAGIQFRKRRAGQFAWVIKPGQFRISDCADRFRLGHRIYAGSNLVFPCFGCVERVWHRWSRMELSGWITM